MTVQSRAVTSTIAILVLLTLLNIWFFPGSSVYREAQTSLGHGPLGYAAVYDLLAELEYPVERSYVRPSRLGDDEVVWFVNPVRQQRLMDQRISVLEELRPWVERGGTAIVFGNERFDWSMLDLTVDEPGPDGLVVQSLWGGQEWVVDSGSNSVAFVAKVDGGPNSHSEGESGYEHTADQSDANAAEGEPRLRFEFVVEVPVGDGRVVAVADSRFLMNPNLDQLDHAALAVELAHTYRISSIDERFHGLRTTETLLGVIGGARLTLLLITVTLLGVVAILYRQRWSARTFEEPEVIEATLGTFVSALQFHYARTRDYPEIFRAYREGFVHRFRRQLGQTESERDFERRLSRDPDLTDELRCWLVRGESPGGETEMIEAVRVLERFAEKRG